MENANSPPDAVNSDEGMAIACAETFMAAAAAKEAERARAKNEKSAKTRLTLAKFMTTRLLAV